MFDENLGFVVRSAGCFGLTDIHVISTIPEEKELFTINNFYFEIVKKNHNDIFLIKIKKIS